MTKTRNILLSSFFALLILPASRGQAQTGLFPEDDNRVFHGGFAIGANFTQVDGDFTAGFNKVGLNVGPMVYAKLSNTFWASMEMLYSQKGSKVRRVTDYGLGTAVESYDIKLNYVEVPVLLQITPAGRLHYSAGASYSYLVRSKEEAFTIAPVNLDPDLYPFNKQDINFIVGLNYRFYNHWWVNFRYARSVISIRDAEHIPEFYGQWPQMNNLFTLRLMYLF